MHFEQRFAVVGGELVIKVEVIFILQGRWLLAPDRGLLVDRFGAAAKIDGMGDEIAVFVYDLAQPVFRGKFLGVIIEVDYDGSAAVSFFCRLNGEGFLIERLPTRGGAVQFVGA